MAAPVRTPGTPHPLDRLGAYVLPGRVADPRAAVGQATTAEHLGLSTIWISERYGTKDLGVLGGAVAQATSHAKIASGISHFAFRHPLALASMAMTMQALSGERFMFGVGRSTAPMWKAVGLPAMTNQVLVDFAEMFRTLCKGGKVRYDGPAGKFPSLRLGDLPDVAPPPILLAGIGPKTLDLAGTHFDGAILHPMLTTEAVARAAVRVRAAAEAAGRDPHSVKVYATVVTAPDLTAGQEAAVVGGRAVTYYQIPEFGELLAGVNGFDPAELATLRSHPMLEGLRGAADTAFTKDQLADVAASLPRHWLEEGTATGSAATCARRLQKYLDAGADEIVIHGAVPDLLGPTLQHFADQ